MLVATSIETSGESQRGGTTEEIFEPEVPSRFSDRYSPTFWWNSSSNSSDIASKNYKN